jgi:hypothetical protein
MFDRPEKFVRSLRTAERHVPARVPPFAAVARRAGQIEAAVNF